MHKTLSYRITVIGVVIALMSVTAAIKIQISLVPISLQSFFPLLVGSVFDKRTAVLSQFGYIVLGLLGFPIFINGGGIGYILRPTFGYLLAMPIATYWIASLLSRRQEPCLGFTLLLINFSGSLIILLLGALWLMIIGNLVLGYRFSADELVIFGILIFLPGEMLKSFAVSVLSPKIKKLLYY